MIWINYRNFPIISFDRPTNYLMSSKSQSSKSRKISIILLKIHCLHIKIFHVVVPKMCQVHSVYKITHGECWNIYILSVVIIFNNKQLLIKSFFQGWSWFFFGKSIVQRCWPFVGFKISGCIQFNLFYNGR